MAYKIRIDESAKTGAKNIAIIDANPQSLKDFLAENKIKVKNISQFVSRVGEADICLKQVEPSTGWAFYIVSE